MFQSIFQSLSVNKLACVWSGSMLAYLYLCPKIKTKTLIGSIVGFSATIIGYNMVSYGCQTYLTH